LAPRTAFRISRFSRGNFPAEKNDHSVSVAIRFPENLETSLFPFRAANRAFGYVLAVEVAISDPDVIR
jgi:hypothetical protein